MSSVASASAADSQLARAASSARPAADSARPKMPRVGRRDAAVRQRAQARAPHQRVGVALVHLIQHRRAAGDERRAGDGLGHRRRASSAAGAAEVVAGGARGDDEEVQARLGERDVVAERRTRAAARRHRERRRVDRRVLHARAPRSGCGRIATVAEPDRCRASRVAASGSAGSVRRSAKLHAPASAASAPATSSAPARRRRRGRC